MQIRNLALLFVLAVLWGPSFLFIKVAVAEIPPLTLAALRVGIAAVLLNGYLFMTGGNLVWTRKFWLDVLVVGVFAHTIPFILINWGQQYIDSALGAILNAITPLSTIVLASIFVKTDKMTLNKMGGSMIGLLGFLILVSPSLSLDLEVSFLGLLAVTVGASAYGVALVYARLNLTTVKSLQAPAGQLLVTSIYIIPAALIIDGPMNISAISWSAWLSVIILASFGTALAFVFYYKLLAKAGPTFVSLVTYLMPIFGVMLGVIFLNESLYQEAIIGGAIILLGVMVVNSQVDLSRLGKLRDKYLTRAITQLRKQIYTKKYSK